MGEALALPFFKVRFTKRKCLARFIQKTLLMVGRQKVLHTILPGAHVLQSLHFSALLLILSTCSPLECTALSPAPVSLAQSFTFSFFFPSFSLYLPIFLSLNFTCLLPVHPAVSPALLLHLSSPLSPLSFSLSYLPLSPLCASSLSHSLSVSSHVLACSEQNPLLTEAEARWRLRDGSYQL